MFDQLTRSRGGGKTEEPSRIAALDLGEQRTRMVIAERAGTGMRVVSWLDEPTPAGLVAAGRVTTGGEIAAWLRRSLARAGLPADDVWTVPWSEVQVKRLQVADAGNREATLRGLAVNPAFRSGVGDTVGAWRQDYHVVDAGAGVVMAVSVRPEAIRAAATAVHDTGAALRGVAVAESAVVHAWLATAPDANARAVLLEAGHNGVTLVVMDSGEPVGFRRVMYGGRVLSERGGWFPPAEIPPPLVEEWSARMAQEIRMLSGAAFRGAADGIPPVSFMGGLGAAEELVAGLETALGAPVERWSAGAGAMEGGVEGGPLDCGMAIAYGIARQALAPEGVTRGPRIQLLRPEDLSERGRAQARPLALLRDPRVRLAAAACLVAAAACASAERWLRMETGRARAGVSAAQADSSRVQADIGRVARLGAERARLGGAVHEVERLQAARLGTARLMERLARAMPAYAWADTLSVEASGAEAGTAFRISGYAGTAGQVAALERAMAGPPVAEVSVLALAPATVAGLPVVRWTMVGRLGAPPPDSPGPGYRRQDATPAEESE